MLALPSELEPFRKQLSATACPFLKGQAQEAVQAPLWATKVGGMPYLPKGQAWPANPEGAPLVFLAQINFAELPPLLPFPENGLVSFFISDDDLYGMNFDDGEDQSYFRTLFFPEIITDTAQLQQIEPPADYDLLPHHPDECYLLSFSRAEELMPATDYRFWQIFGADFFQKFGADRGWELENQFGKLITAQGHKVGGYAYFTQDDPRRADDPMLLLFQLDSDPKMDLMWGDMGVGHFFIREKDLKERNFSRVLYDWDCM